MKLAHRELDVPMVLEPEYLASPWLDELSGMTYLSYFMKPDSTGFKTTLDWVNSRLERPITNFTVSFYDFWFCGIIVISVSVYCHRCYSYIIIMLKNINY